MASVSDAAAHGQPSDKTNAAVSSTPSPALSADSPDPPNDNVGHTHTPAQPRLSDDLREVRMCRKRLCRPRCSVPSFAPAFPAPLQLRKNSVTAQAHASVPAQSRQLPPVQGAWLPHRPVNSFDGLARGGNPGGPPTRRAKPNFALITLINHTAFIQTDDPFKDIGQHRQTVHCSDMCPHSGPRIDDNEKKAGSPSFHGHVCLRLAKSPHNATAHVLRRPFLHGPGAGNRPCGRDRCDTRPVMDKPLARRCLRHASIDPHSATRRCCARIRLHGPATSRDRDARRWWVTGQRLATAYAVETVLTPARAWTKRSNFVAFAMRLRNWPASCAGTVLHNDGALKSMSHTAKRTKTVKVNVDAGRCACLPDGLGVGSERGQWFHGRDPHRHRNEKAQNTENHCQPMSVAGAYEVFHLLSYGTPVYKVTTVEPMGAVSRVGGMAPQRTMHERDGGSKQQFRT